MRNILKAVAIVGCTLFVALAAQADTSLGNMRQILKQTTAATCGSAFEGVMVRQFGGSAEGNTKLCFCKSDGAASPVYQWCSITLTGASTVVCAGGSTTVCP